MRQNRGIPDLDEFLSAFPGLAIRPDGSNNTVLAGDFKLDAAIPGGVRVQESFHLEIRVPPDYPEDRPRVFERSGKIPMAGGKNHINPDGSLCLGSPIRLMMHLGSNPSLVGYMRECVVPFLYAIAHRQQHGGDLVFGELAHWVPGLADDYGKILNLRDGGKILAALKCVLMKKRIANKRPCPCGCQRRLGKCRLRFRIHTFRKLIPKMWLRAHLQELTGKPAPQRTTYY